MRKIGLLILLLLFSGQDSIGQDKYKSYDWEAKEKEYIKFELAGEKTLMTFYAKDTSRTYEFDYSDVATSPEGIWIDDKQLFQKEAFIFDDSLYPLENIDKVEILAGRKRTEVTFIRTTREIITRFSKGKNNLISTIDPVMISEKQFIRGSVINFWGNITINGEVNEDVVAVYGDITIGPTAVIRGDVVAINGRIDLDREASIYGEVESADSRDDYSFDRLTRGSPGQKVFSTYARFYYNRVDGAAPYLGVQFIDEDSLLPRFLIYGGYGFESERWRYHFGFEHSFFKYNPLTFGASYYKKLKSKDDWIVNEGNNTAYALIAGKDYRDYYEATGGRFFVRYHPYSAMFFELGGHIEEHKWLEGHPNMWAFFGGDKKFRKNFSSVTDAIRTNGIETIDGLEIKSLIGHAQFDDRREIDIYDESFNLARIQIEYAPESWNDSVHFTRYMIRLGRHQAITENLGIFGMATFGGSEGNLPMHRKFFVGGLNTIHGYDYKEFMGDKFWLTDFQMRMTIPGTNINGWLFHNAGQITLQGLNLSDSDIKQSVGVGVSFEDSFRINLSRRLDSEDASLKMNVLLGFFW